MKSNSKLVQSALIIIVIGIWGAIGYRVYNAMSEDVEVLPSMYVPKDLKSDAIATPRAQLNLNYNDPFTGKRSKKRPSRTATTRKDTTAIVEVVEPVPPNIIYNGYSYNVDGERRLAIKVDGKLHFAQIGEIIKGCRISSATKDGLRVFFEGKVIDVKREMR